MAKKRNIPDILFKLGVLLLLLFLFSKLKVERTTVYIDDKSIISLLDNPNNPEGLFCEIYTDMNTEFKGNQITFTINDGINTKCNVYGKYNNDAWGYVGEYTTGANGKISSKLTLSTAGTLKLAAICGECVTDQKEIIVKQVQEEEIIVPPQDQQLTCAQKAQDAGAYYKEPILIAKDNTFSSCYGWGSQDCMDKGQTLSGYGLDGTCCLYTCEAIQVQPVTCTDSDSDLSSPDNYQVRGTCNDGSQSIQDSCFDNLLREYYCEPNFDGTESCAYTSLNCNYFIPGTYCVAGSCQYLT